MNRSDLIKQCRYYRGEDENPFDEEQNKAMLWFYEKIWVAKMLANDPYLEEITNEYRSQGLENFSEEDGTPISLKAILFNRYEHWLEGGTDGFKRFYRKTYLCL